MTEAAFYLALLGLGALLSGPFWMNFGSKRTLEDVERRVRRYLREKERR